MTIRVGMWVVRCPEYRNEDWWEGYCKPLGKQVDDKFLVTFVEASELRFAGSEKLASKSKFVPCLPVEMELEDWM